MNKEKLPVKKMLEISEDSHQKLKIFSARYKLPIKIVTEQLLELGLDAYHERESRKQ